MYRKFTRLVFFLVALAFFAFQLSACGGKQVTARQADQGRTIVLKMGETLMVTLDSNPSTGYSWQVSEVDENVLKQDGEPQYKQAADSQGLVGAGGTETFRFQTVGRGKTTLKLIYARSWEKDVPPVETYSLTVVVE